MNHVIESVAIDSLKPRQSNPRVHSKKQIKQIANSIAEFGFVIPILIDASNGIIAGHGRVEAAKLVGMKDVPAIRVDHLTDTQIRAYVIADNKLTLNASWNEGLLKVELTALAADTGFDVTLTGFETGEIDQIIIGGEANEDDDLPEVDRTAPAVSKMGDLWRIGRHAVLCG